MPMQKAEAAMTELKTRKDYVPNYQRPAQVEAYRCWNCRRIADEQP